MIRPLVLLVALAAGASALAQSIGDVLQTGLRDASFTMVVDTARQRELQKINSDFAQSYRFASSTVQMEEPFKLRMEAKVDDMDIVFIVNGTTRLVRVPRAGLNQKEDLGRSPGKRQTAFDFGFLPASLFDGTLFQASFVRTDANTGDLVFDVTYVPSLGDGTRHRIWVNPDTKTMSKRMWYSQIDGSLLATFEYSDIQDFGGVWLPTKATVRNADNVVAGVTRYTGLSVNQGIDDSRFSVN